MNQFKLLCIAVLVGLTSISARALDKINLTLDECVKIGLENSKNLKITQSKIEAAQFKRQEVGTALLPSLKFTTGYTRLSDVEPFKFTYMGREMVLSPTILDNYTVKLSASQALFTGFRNSSNVDMAELNESAISQDFNKDKSQLILDIKNAFWNCYKANESLKSVEDNIRQIQAHLTDVENFYKRGLATDNEVLKVKVQLSNTLLLKLDMENAIELTKYSLNNALGQDLLSDISVKADTTLKSIPLITLNELAEQANRERPEVLAYNSRIKAAEAAVKMSKAGWWPQVYLSGNYNFNQPNSRLMPSQARFYGTWDLSLTLSYDIWNWNLTKHQAAQAEASLKQSELGLSQMKDIITLELAQSYQNVVKSKEKIAVLEMTVEQAKENYRVTNEKFKAGIALNSDLIDAEVALLSAKINYISGIADFEISKAKLEKSIGNNIK